MDHVQTQFLQAAHDLGMGRSLHKVEIYELANDVDLDPNDPYYTSNMESIAQYLETRGFIRRYGKGSGELSITAKGIDEVEGNKPQDTGATFNIYGAVQGSVIGTHNTAELNNTFDYRKIEVEIEQKGGEDKEELHEALAEIRRLLESGQTLNRGGLARFSGVMERHSWFTSAVAQALVGFATQIVGAI